MLTGFATEAAGAVGAAAAGASPASVGAAVTSGSAGMAAMVAGAGSTDGSSRCPIGTAAIAGLSLREGAERGLWILM